MRLVTSSLYTVSYDLEVNIKCQLQFDKLVPFYNENKLENLLSNSKTKYCFLTFNSEAYLIAQVLTIWKKCIKFGSGN